MKKRLLSALLAGLLCTAALTGCGGNANNASDGGAGAGADSGAAADGVITINYPTFQCGVNTAAPVVAQLVEEFNETYAGKYQIVLEEIPGDANYVDKIKVQLGTGDLPPVIYGAG